MLIKWIKEKIKNYKLNQHLDLMDSLEKYNNLNEKVLNLYEKILLDKRTIKDLEVSYKFLKINHIKEHIEERKKVLLVDKEIYKEQYEKLQEYKEQCNNLIKKYNLEKYLKIF